MAGPAAVLPKPNMVGKLTIYQLTLTRQKTTTKTKTVKIAYFSDTKTCLFKDIVVVWMVCNLYRKCSPKGGGPDVPLFQGCVHTAGTVSTLSDFNAGEDPLRPHPPYISQHGPHPVSRSTPVEEKLLSRASLPCSHCVVTI